MFLCSRKLQGRCGRCYGGAGEADFPAILGQKKLGKPSARWARTIVINGV